MGFSVLQTTLLLHKLRFNGNIFYKITAFVTLHKHMNILFNHFCSQWFIGKNRLLLLQASTAVAIVAQTTVNFIWSSLFAVGLLSSLLLYSHREKSIFGFRPQINDIFVPFFNNVLNPFHSYSVGGK